MSTIIVSWLFLLGVALLMFSSLLKNYDESNKGSKLGRLFDSLENMIIEVIGITYAFIGLAIFFHIIRLTVDKALGG